MKKYTVYIEETLCRGIEVEANTIEEAEAKVIAMYHNSEIVLDSNDMGGEAVMMTQEQASDISTEWHDF